MAQFLIKLVNHFASEIITKRLANSRAFQQFAMKTHLKVSRPNERDKRERTTEERQAKHLCGEDRLMLPLIHQHGMFHPPSHAAKIGTCGMFYFGLEQNRPHKRRCSCGPQAAMGVS